MALQDTDIDEQNAGSRALLLWYRKLSASTPSINSREEFHLWQLSKVLFRSDRLDIEPLAKAIELIAASENHFLDHVLATDHLANSLGCSLTDLYSKITEAAILANHGQAIIPTLTSLAERTGLAAFRFLTAWVYLNENNLPACISECEKVDEPFAPVHTLLGQALLESGNAAGAIEALQVALNVSPKDPLPRVQLIKAYLVLGLYVEAAQQIACCRDYFGVNMEIECLAAMVIMNGSGLPHIFCDTTLQNICDLTTRSPDDLDGFLLGMELSTHLRRKGQALALAESLEVSLTIGLVLTTRKLAPVIKKLGELGWHDVAEVVISKNLSLSPGSRRSSITMQ